MDFHDKYITVPESGCWLWLGEWNHSGYGQDRRAHTRIAHRQSWELHFGEIPAGMHVCHKCDTPACVNPDHLFLGTQQENLQDMAAKGRASRGSKRWSAKLTEADVLEIRRNNMMPKEIMARYGIGHAQADRIRAGLKWAHVGGT